MNTSHHSEFRHHYKMAWPLYNDYIASGGGHRHSPGLVFHSLQSHDLELIAALSTGRRYECVGSCRLVNLFRVFLCVSTRTRHRRPRPRHEHRREGDVLDRRHLCQHHRTHGEFSPHAEFSLSSLHPLDRKASVAHESHELRSLTPPLSIQPLSHTVHCLYGSFTH